MGKTLAYAVLDNAVAGLTSIAYFNNLVRQRAHLFAGCRIGEVPVVVRHVKRALVVAMEPSLKTAVQPALEEIFRRQGAQADRAFIAIDKAQPEFCRLHRLPVGVVMPLGIMLHIHNLVSR